MTIGIGERPAFIGTALLVAALLAACGAPDGGGAAPAPTTTKAAPGRGATAVASTTPGRAIGTVARGQSPSAPPNPTRTIAAEHSGSLDIKPTRSTLTYAGQTQAGRTSSFTWTECATGRCRTLHADAPGIVIPPVEEQLTVPAGAELTFTFGGQREPAILGVTAYALDDQSPRFPLPVAGPDWLQRWDQRTTELPARQAGRQAAITADLPPAEYIIVVDLRVRTDPAATTESTAPYGFRVVVRPAPPPPTPRMADPDPTAATPPEGIPAIKPRRPVTGPNEPTFTEDDARAYIAVNGIKAIRIDPSGPYQIESIVFLTNGEARPRLNTGGGGPDDRLLCLVTIRGTFTGTGAPPHPLTGESDVDTLRTVILIFDAHTGNSLGLEAFP